VGDSSDEEDKGRKKLVTPPRKKFFDTITSDRLGEKDSSAEIAPSILENAGSKKQKI